MAESGGKENGWFEGLTSDDRDAAVERVRDGATRTPHDWPALAVSTGFVKDESHYFDLLNAVSVEAARHDVAAREGADDQQVIHAIRTIDDLDRLSNELAERIAEWGRTTGLVFEENREGVVELAAVEPETPIEEEIVRLADEVTHMRERRESLVTTVDRVMHDIAPNLSAMAGPLLGARLISLAGSLERLAKLPSSTVQVLGAEDALFAHLRGEAPSPKHGIIFTHEYVRGTHPDERGSASRALAGKLSIAARIDHYAGDYRPELEDELRVRIERIQERSA